MYEEKNFSTGSLILSFLIGGAVGAGIALLTAPRSGKETREKINTIAGEAKEKISRVAEDARGKIVETISKGKEYIAEKKPVLSGAVDAGKRAMEEEKQRMSHGM
ncbi:MAG: YtxH domain-containing protein [Nitrospirota bacterium]